MAAPLYQLTMRSGPTTGETYPLEQEETLMGRDLANDVAISDPEVSRRHARFVIKEGTVFVEDLGSTNGTFLNGERISNPQQLRPGDVITLGENIVLVFEKASYDLDITPPASLQKEAIPEPPYEQAPMPDTFQPPPEPAAYKQPQTPPPTSSEAPPQQPRPEGVERRQKKGGMPTWLVILIIAIVVIICVIAVTLYFMPASWWCAITFDQLPGCPIP